MALRFGKYIFYHVPKCGGSYVRNVIERMESDRQEICWTHSTPYETRVGGDENLLSFAMVRHPVTWYESYFRYRRTSNTRPWQKDNLYDAYVEAETYTKFILKTMQSTVAGATSYVGHLYAPFINNVTYLIKLEDIHNGLERIFGGWGYDYWKYKVGPIKVSPKHVPVNLPKNLYNRLAMRNAGISLSLGYGIYPSDFTP
jgi:hypothetical protein